MKRAGPLEVHLDHATHVTQSAAPARKVVARYPIATIGSRTSLGGKVVLAMTAGVDKEVTDDFRIACVGDRVRYPDGSESVIISGAGHASTFADRPIALVGSHIANGDRIVTRAQSMGEIVVFEGETIPGLLEPGFGMPPLGAAA
jgi:uncharacterized Zn-binding protein involved in type VI secretion